MHMFRPWSSGRPRHGPGPAVGTSREPPGLPPTARSSRPHFTGRRKSLPHVGPRPLTQPHGKIVGTHRRRDTSQYAARKFNFRLATHRARGAMSEQGPYNQPPQHPYGGGEYGEGLPPYGRPQGGDPHSGPPGTPNPPHYGTGGQPGYGPPGPGQPMYGGGQPP